MNAARTYEVESVVCIQRLEMYAMTNQLAVWIQTHCMNASTIYEQESLASTQTHCMNASTIYDPNSSMIWIQSLYANAMRISEEGPIFHMWRSSVYQVVVV